MADIVTLVNLKTPHRKKKKIREKEKREGILQQHHKIDKDRRLCWI